MHVEVWIVNAEKKIVIVDVSTMGNHALAVMVAAVNQQRTMTRVIPVLVAQKTVMNVLVNNSSLINE